MRAADGAIEVVRLGDDGSEPDVVVADMTGVYAAVAATLDVQPDALNLEGACVVGPVLHSARLRPAAGKRFG